MRSTLSPEKAESLRFSRLSPEGKDRVFKCHQFSHSAQPAEIKAVWSIQGFTGEFRLTGPDIFQIAAQSLIIGVRSVHQLDESNSTVWLRRFSLDCNKPVLQSDPLQVAVFIEKELQGDRGLYVTARFDIESGSHVGELKLVFQKAV